MDKRTETMCMRVPERMALEIEAAAAVAECSVSQFMFLVMREYLYDIRLPPSIPGRHVYKGNAGTQ